MMPDLRKFTMSLGGESNSYPLMERRYPSRKRNKQKKKEAKEDQELDFASKIGTQVGMIAPDFTCISVKGDIIISSNLHDRTVIIANSCGCGGDKLSTETFHEIEKTFGNKIYALRLDFGIERGLEGWHIDMEEEYNRDVYNKYRNAYCSRISYVIGKNGRIIDTFMITDWKPVLFGIIYD
jgi:hypothetical protein